MREIIRSELEAIVPFDALETEHLADAIAWVDSGAEIFRVAKHATPPKHLVSYFVIVDGDHILLVDHKSAQLWLPSGGHVEPDEHPRTHRLARASGGIGLHGGSRDVGQIQECRDYFGTKLHPARRTPGVFLEHYWQRWFERLPPGLLTDSKRLRVLKALDKALDQFAGQASS